MNKLKQTMSTIHASQQLKTDTLAFLREEAQRHTSPRPAFRPGMRMLAACACLVLVLLGIGGVKGYEVYQTPVSYVSIDVNPSLELGLNRWDRVVCETAYNEDAERVLERVSVRNLPCEAAIEKLMASSALGKYLQGSADVTFTVVSEHDEALISAIENCKAVEPYSSYLCSAEAETMEKAHKHGCSVGKYQAYQELAAFDETVTPEDCKSMTMHEIHDAIQSHMHAESAHEAEPQHESEAETHENEQHHEEAPVSEPEHHEEAASEAEHTSENSEHEESHQESKHTDSTRKKTTAKKSTKKAKKTTSHSEKKDSSHHDKEEEHHAEKH